MSITSITPARLAELRNKEQSIEILDVRTPAEYREVHLEGSRNIPLGQLDPAAIQGEQADSPNRTLYIVCRSGARGRQACERLLKAGMDNAINIEGGTMACIEAGLPVVRGRKAVSLERQVRIAAGLLVLIGSSLAWFVHPAFIIIAAFVGGGLTFSGITDTCGMAMILARMPWNQN